VRELASVLRAVTIERIATIVTQTRSRLAGQMPDSATRLVSLHDPDARPIRKGRIDRRPRSGTRPVPDNDDGLILDYGAAPTARSLRPPSSGSRRADRTPRAVTSPNRGWASPPSSATFTRSACALW
jgi:transposase, IS5 family